MPRAYTENPLVEQPAVGLFMQLGWDVALPRPQTSQMSDSHPALFHREREKEFETTEPKIVVDETGLYGRETTGDVVLIPRLRAALEHLNPGHSGQIISAAIDELTRDRSAMHLEHANREVHALLKNGVTVSVSGKAGEAPGTERLQVVDWQNPANNDFLLVSQFTVTGPLNTCRPDLVGFVNGLPLVVIELKKPGIPARTAFDENLTGYKHKETGIPALFVFNALLIASNGAESRVGSITSDWGRFFEWKRVERENEPRRVSLEVMIRGTCDKARLLDIIENFTLFSERKSGLVKIISQNHQYLGVNNALISMLTARKAGHGRGGVFWQTQGSGKSLSMVFFAQKVLRKIPGNWTFVVVTDRTELDEQTAKTFEACGVISQEEGDRCHAASAAHLRELLLGDHRFVFTLIQKFQFESRLAHAPSAGSASSDKPEAGGGDAGGTMPVLTGRPDIIVLADEAHRSHYDTLALNMRAAMPKATFLAFTGTPLTAGEERTKEVFGDYVSIYDFQQSVEDGATTPLFYENRAPELKLANPDSNYDIYKLIESAELDPEQESKLERELGKRYQMLTADDRLETIARDIVQHFLARGFDGKAMVVSIDRATALKMHDKVRKHWKAELDRAQKELSGNDLPKDRRVELAERLRRLKATDMAVIVSPAQNEIEQMNKLGLDIVPHRKRMKEEPLAEKFKDSNDPLRIVFVGAMWLTGFDAPNCSTVYLDKPMRNHTLMQTIARANRVFPGKHSGIIVDYANVFASLEKALAAGGEGHGSNGARAGSGAGPAKDKKRLIEDLRLAVDAAVLLCGQHGIILADIEQLPAGDPKRSGKFADAVNALISPDPLRSDFLSNQHDVSTLFSAAKPDPAAREFAGKSACLTAIADAIRAKLNPLDAAISALDLSEIDFDAARRQFEEAKHKNTELEVLKAAVRARLDRLVRLNHTRVDFQEKFEELIDSHNNGSRNIEELFEELLKLSHYLREEQQRHVRESVTEEELVIFDILTRPAPELSVGERDEVKEVSRELLEKLKQLLVLDWRKRSPSRSQVKLTIEETLDTGLPRAYTPDLYQRKCAAVFEHFYEAYQEAKNSAYAEAT